MVWREHLPLGTWREAMNSLRRTKNDSEFRGHAPGKVFLVSINRCLHPDGPRCVVAIYEVAPDPNDARAVGTQEQFERGMNDVPYGDWSPLMAGVYVGAVKTVPMPAGGSGGADE